MMTLKGRWRDKNGEIVVCHGMFDTIATERTCGGYETSHRDPGKTTDTKLFFRQPVYVAN